MRLKITTYSLALLAATAFVPVSAWASITTVPAGLNPGDQYRLVFVTSGTPDTTTAAQSHSSDIEYYNKRVQGTADSVPELAALGVWKAIASTQTVSARQNTNTHPSLGGVPIFLLNGNQFAVDYVDLWDVTNIVRDLDITETGASLKTRVWTGNGHDGTTPTQQYLGDVVSGHNPVMGNSQISSGTFEPFPVPWGGGWVFDTLTYPSVWASLYAMSDILTVPDSTDPGVVPEPVSMLTWCGLALTAYWGKTSRRRRA